MRLPRRMAGMTGKAFVFPAKEALRIGAGFYKFRLGNIPRVLFRLGQINGNIQITKFRSCLPNDVLVNPVLADVIGGNAHLVEIIRCCLRRTGIVALESAHHFRRTGHNAVHQTGIE